MRGFLGNLHIGGKGRVPMRPPYLHHVTIEITPELVGACRVFYERTLGLHEIKSKIKNTVWYIEGVHLFYGFQAAPDQDRPRHFALVVGSKYTKIRQICSDQGRLVSDGTEYWGSPRCFVRDPAGNKVELMEFPPK